MKKILLYLLALCATASATTLETQATDQMSWKPTAYNFQVPAYFSDGTEYFYGDGPYSMVIYKHQDAQLSYCSLLGNWACDDEAFPVPGSVLAQNATIKNIVYHAKNGVFSGYTTDGRIFYMKKKSQPNAVAPEEGFSICHSSFLAIIYPKSRQKEMDPVIQMINKIKSFEGSSQSSTPLTYKSPFHRVHLHHQGQHHPCQGSRWLHHQLHLRPQSPNPKESQWHHLPLAGIVGNITTNLLPSRRTTEIFSVVAEIFSVTESFSSSPLAKMFFRCSPNYKDTKILIKSSFSN